MAVDKLEQELEQAELIATAEGEEMEAEDGGEKGLEAGLRRRKGEVDAKGGKKKREAVGSSLEEAEEKATAMKVMRERT